MEDLLQRLVDEDYGFEKGNGKWGRSLNHDSLVVNIEDQTWFWNSKGIKGDTLGYLILVRGLSKDKAKEFLKNSFGGLSEISDSRTHISPYEKLVYLMWTSGKINREYWYKRCLKDETIDRYRLGHFEGWSLVPLYDEGEFVNFQMRRDIPDKRIFYWYKTERVLLFNSSILPFTKTIYITEGLVDAILLNQEGFPSVSACGVNTWRQDWFNLFSGIETIYYLEDNDAAGRIGARSVAKCLGTGRVKIVSFTGKAEKYDTGDFFKEGNTASQFKEHVNNNSKYLFELEKINENLSRSRPRWRTV